MSDDINEILHQWEKILTGWSKCLISRNEAMAFYEKHGPAITAAWERREKIRKRSRPCPVCKARVGKPCKKDLGQTPWPHVERYNKEAA